jgi:hypothetical protein
MGAVTSRRSAAALVNRLHLVLLFPTPRLPLPSLWEAVAGEGRPVAEKGWGELEERVWAWKNELPGHGLAWYGRFVQGRQTFLSLPLLADLYAGAGEPEDHRAFDLSADAHRVADTLVHGGAMPLPAVRMAVGLDGKAGKTRFERAIRDLAGALLVTPSGIYEGDGGWPATVLDLTSRRFDLRGRSGVDVDRARARVLRALERFNGERSPATERLVAKLVPGPAVKVAATAR